MTAIIKKIVVSHRGALRRKYGDTLAGISAAIDRVVAADANRGVTTEVVWLDDPGFADAYGSPPVADGGGDRSTKDAIEAVIVRHGEPDYLLILGAPDVVPHQMLTDPVLGDADTTTPSDLPYASAAPFSRDCAAFVGATRKVGRLPDVAGGTAPEYLVGLLDAVATFKPGDAAQYARYFAACAQGFEATTRLTLADLFGDDDQLTVSPPTDATTIDATSLARPAQFYDCHGGAGNPNWYGNKPGQSVYPVLLRSADLPALPQNTVVATEACYGTQLYAPGAGEALPLCNAFLRRGAIGVFGSTDILYGNLVDGKQIQGDLLTQYFLDSLIKRGAASLGAAGLDARHRFVQACGTSLDPYQLKTLAQCLLLGDPSLAPIAAPGVAAAPLTLPTPPVVQQAAHRKRQHEASRALGHHLQRTTRVARHRATEMPGGPLGVALRDLIRQAGLIKPTVRTYSVEESAGDRAVLRVHAIHGHPRAARQLGIVPLSPLPRPEIVVLVREEHGALVAVKRLHRR